MRADRLLSILMLLQGHGKMSAPQLAAELGVSVRTIYRDVDALQAAGVPLYSEEGRGGGYGLVDSYRTTLTGLTAGERQALLLLTIPAPLAGLTVGRELEAALRKVVAALPGSPEGEESLWSQRLHLDAIWWFQESEPVPHLPLLQQAVLADEELRLHYRLPIGVEVARLVAPYGLVAKAGVWYLVYADAGRVRAQRVTDLLTVTATGIPFTRPLDFDLATFWAGWCRRREAEQNLYRVQVRISPDLVPYLPAIFGVPVSAAGPPDATGWHQLALAFNSFETARSRLLGCGGAVEVLAPLPLRQSIADFAAQTVALYNGGDPPLS